MHSPHRTCIVHRFIVEGERDLEAWAVIVARTPFVRPGNPQEATGIMVDLASDESAYEPGALLRVDRGLTSP